MTDAVVFLGRTDSLRWFPFCCLLHIMCTSHIVKVESGFKVWSFNPWMRYETMAHLCRDMSMTLAACLAETYFVAILQRLWMSLWSFCDSRAAWVFKDFILFFYILTLFYNWHSRERQETITDRHKYNMQKVPLPGIELWTLQLCGIHLASRHTRLTVFGTVVLLLCLFVAFCLIFQQEMSTPSKQIFIQGALPKCCCVVQLNA